MAGDLGVGTSGADASEAVPADTQPSMSAVEATPTPEVPVTPELQAVPHEPV